MKMAIVMPCLNEEALLEESCASLGFGRHRTGAQPTDTLLILVDNGSRDRTIDVMESIRAQSLPGSVLIVSEPERGYVPARHAGVNAARDVVQQLGLGDIFVLQADADTLYSEGYASEMARVGLSGTRDAVLEAAAVAPREFRLAYPGFLNACRETDSAIVDLADDDDSIVVSDAACAYFLSRYYQWGGHRREYASSGDELYAETSRLFIRAKLHGAVRLRVNTLAFPSRRKVVADPGMYFATAGFPREDSWRRRWKATHLATIDLSEFERNPRAPLLCELVSQRQAHLVILFFVLPALVKRAIEPHAMENALIAPLLDACPRFERESLLKSTGSLFECSFSLMATYPDQVGRVVDLLRATAGRGDACARVD